MEESEESSHGSLYYYTNHTEKRFWRIRLNIVVALSVFLTLSCFFLSGAMILKASNLTTLLKDDASAHSPIAYTNNPQIETYAEKMKIYLYFDITLKAVLLLVCCALFLVVYSALKTNKLQDEKEGLLDSSKSYQHPSNKSPTTHKRQDSSINAGSGGYSSPPSVAALVNSGNSAVGISSLSGSSNSDVIKEGIVCEPYTEAMIIALANDESATPFSKVNTAMYKYGPKAANMMIQRLESTLAEEELQYLQKMISDKQQ